MHIPAYVLRALDLLREGGYEAYVVGGAVRDALLGNNAHDYDITTSALPEEMRKFFSDYRTVETGMAHGTLTVIIDALPLEITTFRIDGDYTDMRHPNGVTFTRSLREDAARRDFTVNAMAYHPQTGVLDFFGGKEDLSSHKIRAVGDPVRRFTEDALRILRALRFASELDFTIEEQTAKALFACKDGLRHISAERIREEFTKLLCGKAVYRILKEYTDILAVVIPEILPLVGWDQKSVHHAYDVWEHSVRAVAFAPLEKHLRLAAFFHDFGKPSCFSSDKYGQGHFYNHAKESAAQADAVLTRLRFDRKTKEYVTLLVAYHDLLPEPGTKQFKRLRSRYGDTFLSDWLRLIRADRTAQMPSLPLEKEEELRVAEDAANALLTEESRFSRRDLAVSGTDLMACGIEACPLMGKLIEDAFEAVIDERVRNEKQPLIDYILKKKKEIESSECTDRM